MKTQISLSLVVLLVLLSVIPGQAQGPEVQAPLGNGFSYQGQLRQGGSPYSGTCDFQFSLWDAASGGAQLGGTLTRGSVEVTRGLFNVLLDFGAGAFTGDARWMGIKVRCPAGSGDYTTLVPRQALTPVPYALYAAASAGGAGGAFWALAGNAGTNPATQFVGTTDNKALEIRVNNLRAFRIEPNTESPNLIGGWNGNWVQAGAKGGTISGGGISTNLNAIFDHYGTVGGGASNGAGTNNNDPADAVYATVGGGDHNKAGDDFATVAGGKDNQATGFGAAIGGGEGNHATSGYATISGGNANTASGASTAIGGGQRNVVSGTLGTVGGGWSNVVSGDYSTIGGGSVNRVSGGDATIAGGADNIVSGTAGSLGGGWRNVITGGWATIGGGIDNVVSGEDATVGGGGSNAASGGQSTVGGGAYNAASANYATIGGGGPLDPENPNPTGNRAIVPYATIGGGADNVAGIEEDDPNLVGRFPTVGGGVNNFASGEGSTIAGGGDNTATAYSAIAGGYSNRTLDSYAAIGGGASNVADWLATVGGGYQNTAGAKGATIGGGIENEAAGEYSTVGGGGPLVIAPELPTKPNKALDDYSTIGGGCGNVAGSGDGNPETAAFATVGGGLANSAGGMDATVGGGSWNSADGKGATVGGGSGECDALFCVGNRALGDYSTIAGGWTNIAEGDNSTVPGGAYNSAKGNYSFAAGRRAIANNPGCFVWGDSTDKDMACNTPNAWVARASGGVTFYTNTTMTTGVKVSAGGGSWSSASDRNLKANFAPVDGQDVLRKLAGIPITLWNYKSQDKAIRHIGPVAQDFYAAFGVGEDNVSISTIDADGVALAAIQGLYEIVQEKDARIAALEAENADLQSRMAALEAIVAQLAQGGK